MKLQWVILHESTADTWGGIENWLLKIARGLRQAGDACAVLASPASRWPAVCRQESIPFYPFPFGHEWHPHHLGRLMGLLWAVRPDIVLCTRFREARRVRYVSSRPVIAVKLPLLHDLSDSLLDRLSFRHAVDRLFTDHRNARRLLLRHPWVPSGKVVLIPNGVAIPPPDARADLRRRARAIFELHDPEAVVVGVASRFTAEKRVMDALQIFRAAAATYPAAYLVLIGDGPQRGLLMRAARELGDRVRFMGWRDDAAELLCGCDVVLHTGASEAMPNSVLEGMAAGAAVITTSAGGTPDIITSGRDGFLYEGEDLAAAIEWLRRVFADAALRARMGSSAIRRIMEGYSIERVITQMREGMSAVVEARRQLFRRPEKGPQGFRWLTRQEAGALTPDEMIAWYKQHVEGFSMSQRIPERERARCTCAAAATAVRLFRRAHRLELLGVPVVRQRAVIWRRRGLRPPVALVVFERPAHAIPAPEWVARHADLPAALRLAATAAGTWLAGLHTLRMVPKRLEADHVLIRLGTGILPEFIIENLDTWRLRLAATPKAMSRNFAHLYAVFAGALPRRHLLRFAAAYRRTRGMSRRAIRRLLRFSVFDAGA